MSSDDPYREILQNEGFQLIGQINYRLRVTAWWNPDPDKRLQVLLVEVGGATLLKGDKTYHLKSISAEGETWVRDIASFHDYLENHFQSAKSKTADREKA